MKGLKIRVAGKVEAKIIQALGAVPVTLPSAELPQALQRGVVDGALMNPWSAPGRGVEEFCKYMLVYSLSEQSTPIYVKASTWAAWPDNVKEILSEAAAAWEKNMLYLITEKYELKRDIIPFYEKAGMKSVFPTEDDAKAFGKTLKPVVDWWVEQVGEDVGRKALEYADFKY
jgi:TRAP-type C4-dicarboxylate transport system substrate-binding protein